MIRIGLLLAALALSVPAQAQWSVQAHAASTGLGGGVAYRWSEQLAARGGWQGMKINDFDIDVDQDTQNSDVLDHSGDLTLNVGHLLLDWYPRGGSFRVSAGALLNLSDVDVTSRCTAPSSGGLNPIPGDCEFGFGEFNQAELGTIQTDIEFNTFAPYAGIGWDWSINRDWQVVADLGVAYIGSPDADMTSTGTCDQNPACRAQIEREEKELEEELKDFKIYPVLSLGFRYRFAR